MWSWKKTKSPSRSPKRRPLNFEAVEQRRLMAGDTIGPYVPEPLLAEDAYGNTLSVEEWMDMRAGLPTAHQHTGPFDFYSPYFNPNKPNIWRE